MLRPAGYAELIKRYGLDVIPNWHRSLVADANTHKITSKKTIVEEIFPSRYWPGETPGDHLEFALKYDGINLAILACLFKIMEAEHLLPYLKSRPTGKYARRLWFLYEFVTGKDLPLEDIKRGNYIDMLTPEDYYTAEPGRRVKRQRINNNLPGVNSFCPMVRRTSVLQKYENINLPGRFSEIASRYSAAFLKRAMSYLYIKETKSSFEIEHIKAEPGRTERFIAMLHAAENADFLTKERLIELQNSIVDPRFRELDYRKSQNYVGETAGWKRQKIHFVSPKPRDLPGLMKGLIDSHRRMGESGLPAVIHAAITAYGFVFLHPFEDGNGRIHRFLIHNILAGRGFTPEGIIFPVSASMLNNLHEYDASLEAFSRPLLPLVDYILEEDGRITVKNDTVVWYSYIDFTPQAEALFGFIEKTIETELLKELSFLSNYDRVKKAIREIVDMPDRKIDLFIKVCLQNNGKLSAKKRADYFDFLTDEEAGRMEKVVLSSYESNNFGDI